MMSKEDVNLLKACYRHRLMAMRRAKRLEALSIKYRDEASKLRKSVMEFTQVKLGYKFEVCEDTIRKYTREVEHE